MQEWRMIPPGSGIDADPEAEMDSTHSPQTEKEDEEKFLLWLRARYAYVRDPLRQMRTGGGIPTRRRARLQPLIFFLFFCSFCPLSSLIGNKTLVRVPSDLNYQLC